MSEPKTSDDPTPSRAFESATEDGFSGVALVRYRGDVLLHRAAGLADRERSIPNTTETVFDIGSVTKQFTAALVMALQEAGLLRVADTLADHFDGVPADKAGITLHQLLTHTAGFGDGFGADDVPIDLDTFLALSWATPLRFAPGTVHRYSNAGYGLAAAVIERVSGRPYEAALKAYLLDPAGLAATGHRLPDWSDRTLAIGYGEWGHRACTYGWGGDGPHRNLRGSGGLLGTSGDLLAWLDALAAGDVLGADSVAALRGRHVDETLGRSDSGDAFYGYGWVTQDVPGPGTVHWHDGGNGYFRAFVACAADEDLVVVTLANEANDAAGRLAGELGRAAIAAG